ncbi:uncharacterized protein Nmlp_1180 [Natronomonas moolapensis 8.8.11]|uniref:Uncharacterized protein n=1 Tax=Natronomonas moolapensis (strain DSM 18674 / CECT 7526 / JCM 14361 / 8.8.11) TaxID=268739 RepID=M1XNC3_NATM8|nr:hypothetical protein [Natronomonas moolapensis]CCQ35390.1 uncharacterized protein Nmlp_1180 [Natronomonas moolapensis 8.8.11]
MELLDTLALFGTVALAAPIGLLGAEFLVGGRTVSGVGFLAVALALVAGGYFRPSPKSIVAGRVADAATTDGGDEPARADDGDDGRE